MAAVVLPSGVPTRREIAYWLGGFLFARYVLTLAHAAFVYEQVGEKIVNLFQFFAWYVLFRLLKRSDGLEPARASDFAFFGLCAVVACLPGDSAIWIAATLASAYLFVSRNNDPYRSSAAAILATLATNGFWGPMLFKFLGLWLLDFDSWLVANVLHTAGMLTAHTGTEVTVGNDNMEIGPGCSSFHNISLALLAWLSLTKFVRPYWARTDAAFAFACVAVTIAWNTVRLTILALNAGSMPAFEFWHTGTGAQILSAALAFTIAAVSVAGALRAET